MGFFWDGRAKPLCIAKLLGQSNGFIGKVPESGRW